MATCSFRVTCPRLYIQRTRSRSEHEHTSPAANPQPALIIFQLKLESNSKRSICAESAPQLKPPRPRTVGFWPPGFCRPPDRVSPLLTVTNFAVMLQNDFPRNGFPLRDAESKRYPVLRARLFTYKFFSRRLINHPPRPIFNQSVVFARDR